MRVDFDQWAAGYSLPLGAGCSCSIGVIACNDENSPSAARESTRDHSPSMIEPVHLENFFIAFFAGAMVIVGGALYALLFALSRVHRYPQLMPFAYGAYGVLAASVLALAYALNLNGLWQGLVYVMLIGYLLAPHGIWHLCVGTHSAEHREAEDAHDTSRVEERF
jgi:hypothetical protein